MVEQRDGVFSIDAFIQPPGPHRLSRRIPNNVQVKVVERQFGIRLILPFAPEAAPRKEHPLILLLAHYGRGGLHPLVRLAVVDVWLAVPAIDMAHDGRVRVVNRNIRNLDVRRRLELLEHLEKVTLCRIRHELAGQLAFLSDAEHDCSTVLVQEGAQRLAGVASLPGGLFHLHHLALVVGNQFAKFFKRHIVPPQDILPREMPPQILEQKPILA